MLAILLSASCIQSRRAPAGEIGKSAYLRYGAAPVGPPVARRPRQKLTTDYTKGLAHARQLFYGSVFILLGEVPVCNGALNTVTYSMVNSQHRGVWHCCQTQQKKRNWKVTSETLLIIDKLMADNCACGLDSI